MATKKSNPNGSGIRQFLPRARVLLILAVIGLLGWGMQRVWQQVAPSVIYRDRYLLSADRITITELPSWISTDVRTEVIQNSGLNGRLSMLDDAFMHVVEDAFLLHPWVESVDRIVKQNPRGVHVDLTYREPVAVVEMAGKHGTLYVPIDKNAIHLPIDDVPEIKKRYLPRIGGVVSRPPAGQKWDDERVVGAVSLAIELSQHWSEFHLVDILPSARPEIRGDHRFFVYDLITRGGTRIVWGPAPLVQLSGEDGLQKKINRLRQCVMNHGNFDSMRGPKIVDVRHELAITPREAKKPSEVKQAAKEPKSVKQAAKERETEVK